MEGVNGNFFIFGFAIFHLSWDKLMNGEAERFITEFFLVSLVNNVQVCVKPDFVRVLTLFIMILFLIAEERLLLLTSYSFTFVLTNIHLDSDIALSDRGLHNLQRSCSVISLEESTFHFRWHVFILFIIVFR